MRDIAIGDFSAFTSPLRMASLSNRQKRRFKERMSELRTRYKNRERKDRKLINPVKDARYDAIYDEGMIWLDSLAGEPLRGGKRVVRFSGEVWKSPTGSEREPTEWS